MTQTKRGFIESLQVKDTLLSPYEISQEMRLAIGCVSVCSFDEQLQIEHFRGYMIRHKKRDRSPENPELYDCVVSTNQSRAWQHIVWIKEILHIFDQEKQRTQRADALKEMLLSRDTGTPSNGSTGLNVIADKEGLVLALGSAVPRRYRTVLRDQEFLQRYTPEQLEVMLTVPKEKMAFLLDAEFEVKFNSALENC
ncbi:hypothetical protein HCZ23_00515 [Celeribacter sp. HF31]|uniref:hypothetical protein n=1 Tax=Celeribacter sp. HF31 TaxID=2721558 RepID=UPI001430F4BB|nr:hypothetical protein [Celeribacter sp. HF31]NIY77953.1 hypothetical protein [Celeribacter sp. HF31]